MALRAIPIRRAGNRTNLFMGGDRELVMFTGLIAFALVFSAQELRASLYGMGTVAVFAIPAKTDGKSRSPNALCLSSASSLPALLPGTKYAVQNKPEQSGATVPMIETLTWVIAGLWHRAGRDTTVAHCQGE